MTHAEQTIADLEKRLKELEVEEQRLKTALTAIGFIVNQSYVRLWINRTDTKKPRRKPKSQH